LSRLDRQHELVGAIANQVRRTNVLTSTSKLYSFVNAATESVTTSPALGSVQTIAGLAFSLRHADSSAVTAVTAPYAGDPNDPANVILTSAAQEVFDALAEDRPLPASVTGASETDDDAASPSRSTSPSGSSSRKATTPSRPSTPPRTAGIPAPGGTVP
jgi:anionic cell wall polymer biosynthesis LytR-Cps2A-Psr (LCP) family protein